MCDSGSVASAPNRPYSCYLWMRSLFAMRLDPAHAQYPNKWCPTLMWSLAFPAWLMVWWLICCCWCCCYYCCLSVLFQSIGKWKRKREREFVILIRFVCFFWCALSFNYEMRTRCCNWKKRENFPQIYVVLCVGSEYVRNVRNICSNYAMKANDVIIITRIETLYHWRMSDVSQNQNNLIAICTQSVINNVMIIKNWVGCYFPN